MRRVLKGFISLVLIFSFSLASAGGCGSCCSPCCGPCYSSCCDPCCGPCGSCCDPCCGSSCGSCCNDCDDCCKSCSCGYPFLSARSQGVNAARELVGWQQFINKSDMDCNYGAYSITTEYTRSYKPKDITQFFFGQSLVGCNYLLIQGSEVRDRHSKAWLADYFGLPTNFESKVTFCPTIENVIVDLNFYWGLAQVKEGLYFRLHVPFAWTRRKLNMCEFIGGPCRACTDGRVNCLGCDAGCGFCPDCCSTLAYCNDFEDGYMAAGSVSSTTLPNSFTEAMSGCTTWGDMKTPMKHGLMTNCAMTKVGIADLHAVVGWNFLLDEDYHFGLNLRVGFPTGNRPVAKYLFEPIIGNGKHWELGAGLTGSYVFWRDNECEDRYAAFHLDANISHLFKACQCRSFDFCQGYCDPCCNNGSCCGGTCGSSCCGPCGSDCSSCCDPCGSNCGGCCGPCGSDCGGCCDSGCDCRVCGNNSRYMLLAEMGKNENEALKGGASVGTAVAASHQYQRALMPAINLTSYKLKVRINVQADIVAKFSYNRGNWSFDWGYNLWARSGETFDCCCLGPANCCDCCGPCNGCNNSCCDCGDCCNSCCDSSCGSCCGYDDCCGCDTYCNDKLYAMKGDAYLYGYKGEMYEESVPLSSSQRAASIYSGTNAKEEDASDRDRNKGVDEPQLAWDNTDALCRCQDGTSQLYTSIQPKLVSSCDVNFCKSPSALTHKFFSHYSYTWKDRDDTLIPFLGVGYEIEFGRNTGKRIGISQWGVWLKGGVSFE